MIPLEHTPGTVVHTGSSQDQISGAISRVCKISGNEALQALETKHETLGNLLSELRKAVEQKRKAINYDYGNYKKRLCQSDDFLEKTFQEQVLGDESISKLYEAITLQIPEANKEFLIKKLTKEYCEDLILESMENIPEALSYRIKRKENLDEYLEEIKKTGKNGIKYLDLANNNLGEFLGTDGMVQLVETAGKHGIKSLNLRWNRLGEYLGTDGMLQLVETAGENGIKSLNLVYNNLGEYLGTDGMLQLVETAGKHGIKSLGLSENDLGEYLGTDGTIQLVETAGENGIKSLNLVYNNLGEYLGTDGMLQLVETAGENGIKSLDLRWNDLGADFTEQLTRDFPNIKLQF